MVRNWTKVYALTAIVTFLCILIQSERWGGAQVSKPEKHAASSSWAIYDADSQHIWYRLYVSLFRRTAPDGREYGNAVLDPLVWPETKYLTQGEGHETAVRILEEFIETSAEKLIDDPIKKAILQRDLWAIFDWSVSSRHKEEQRRLQKNLARVIRRLALSPEEIRLLPTNYPPYELDSELKGLPGNLFDPNGPWLQLSSSTETPTATGHAYYFGGRSAFLVFAQLPIGRDATKTYFDTLSKLQLPFPRPLPFRSHVR